MYYEEKIINGVLCNRYTPKDRFRPMSNGELLEKIKTLEAKLEQAQGEIKELGHEARSYER